VPRPRCARKELRCGEGLRSGLMLIVGDSDRTIGRCFGLGGESLRSDSLREAGAGPATREEEGSRESSAIGRGE
jgi:hypothetical protein